MWYYQADLSEHRRTRSGVVSALVEFINQRMDQLGKQPAQVADDGGIKRQTLSYILNKSDDSGKPVRPSPETIKGIAKGLDVPPSLLTSLMGYPVDPIPDIDERLYEIARQLLGAPWLTDRMQDLLALPRSEFDELMDHLEFRRDQRRKDRHHRNGNQSKP